MIVHDLIVDRTTPVLFTFRRCVFYWSMLPPADVDCFIVLTDTVYLMYSCCLQTSMNVTGEGAAFIIVSIRKGDTHVIAMTGMSQQQMVACVKVSI